LLKPKIGKLEADDIMTPPVCDKHRNSDFVDIDMESWRLRRLRGGPKQKGCDDRGAAKHGWIIVSHALTASGPAVTHASGFKGVSAASPAAPGEVLSVFATDLGPTQPGVDPGQPFPSSPPAMVTSAVEVRVNGKPAEVLGAVGLPATVGGYQVNFRLPADTPRDQSHCNSVPEWALTHRSG
jgi:hypothetical protein